MPREVDRTPAGTIVNTSRPATVRSQLDLHAGLRNRAQQFLNRDERARAEGWRSYGQKRYQTAKAKKAGQPPPPPPGPPQAPAPPVPRPRYVTAVVSFAMVRQYEYGFGNVRAADVTLSTGGHRGDAGQWIADQLEVSALRDAIAAAGGDVWAGLTNVATATQGVELAAGVQSVYLFFPAQ